MKKIRKRIKKPSDMHVHFRFGVLMMLILSMISRRYKYGIAMGNLEPPISCATEAITYSGEIRQCPTNSGIVPIPTIMFLNNTTKETIREAARAGIRIIKLISSGTSTNSFGGVPLIDLEKKQDLFEEMEKWRMFFSFHCELAVDPKTGKPIHWQEREKLGIPFFEYIIRKFPGIKFIFEHLSSKEAVDFVSYSPDNLAATITSHHPKLTWKDVISAPRSKRILSPHNYCLPMAKTIADQMAIIAAMTSGNPKFFAGSDMALHWPEFKGLIDPRAGIFNPYAIEDYFEIFEQEDALDKAEDFLSVFGPTYYELEIPEETIELRKESWIVPAVLEGGIIPFGANTEKTWRVMT